MRSDRPHTGLIVVTASLCVMNNTRLSHAFAIILTAILSIGSIPSHSCLPLAFPSLAFD